MENALLVEGGGAEHATVSHTLAAHRTLLLHRSLPPLHVCNAADSVLTHDAAWGGGAAGWGVKRTLRRASSR
eukprot:6191525-Pleurochrysis_carterae.AAC.1